MNRKIWPWLILVAMSAVAPFAHFLMTHRIIEPYTPYWLFDVVTTTVAIYWWYLVDKQQRKFVTGGTQNISVFFLTIIGLPVYFVRSRGWARGALATLVGFVIFVGLSIVAYFSELLGQRVAL